ncbi:response regulator [Ancylomarina sp. 16SWW S1-10-2]|uniref:response regulator n=1 Tax=Ancylomarina sp. 16SWW S1-10-2 TaxID=2499681 RepID=UPI0012AE2917|nr:response regulator [Ancylomarina sp. 16SWW S1-10-2]MRT94298.1 response regulator [Ancylomarina sp. 16SWW S1-10-2]
METKDILYIEDNPNDIELTLRALRKHNVANSIQVIKDGEEALEYTFATGRYVERDKNERPKIILLDLKLPKVGGLEILKKLKSEEQTQNIPVVVLTSSSEEQDILESYNYGVNSYVVKPIKFENFSEAVSTLGLYWLLINESL